MTLLTNSVPATRLRRSFFQLRSSFPMHLKQGETVFSSFLLYFFSTSSSCFSFHVEIDAKTISAFCSLLRSAYVARGSLYFWVCDSMS